MFSLMQMVCNFLYQITFEPILKIAKLYLSLHAPFPCERKFVVDLNIIYSKDLSIKKQQNVFTNVETNLKHIFNQACNFKEMEFFFDRPEKKRVFEKIPKLTTKLNLEELLEHAIPRATGNLFWWEISMLWGLSPFILFPDEIITLY